MQEIIEVYPKVVKVYPEEYHAGYSAGYEDGYRRCEEQHRMRAAARRERRVKEAKRVKYFLKQKLIGVATLALTVVAVKLLNDATIAFFLAPWGLLMMFSKGMVWMDDYYYEVQEKEAQG